MKFIKLFENFEGDYTLGDVIMDAYEINYILDEQNISTYYSFLTDENVFQIGTTDPHDSDVLINKLNSMKNTFTTIKRSLDRKMSIGDMITISFYDNDVNKYHQVSDINDDNRNKFYSYFNLLKDHLEPFDGLSIEMKPYKLYPAAAPVLTVIIKKIK